MGSSYRKSVSLGPLRMNFSKKGVSYSVGVKGACVKFSPGGTHVTLRYKGISYRQKISEQSPPLNQIISHPESVNNIASPHIGQLTDSNSKAFVTELNEKCKKVSYLKVFGGLPLVTIIIILLLVSWKKQQVIIQPATDTAIVRVHVYEDVKIREAPNPKAHVIQKAVYDQIYVLLDSTSHHWFKVRFNNTIGFVNRKQADIKHKTQEQISAERRVLINPYLGYELLLWGLCLMPFLFFLRKVDKKRIFNSLAILYWCQLLNIKYDLRILFFLLDFVLRNLLLTTKFPKPEACIL